MKTSMKAISCSSMEALYVLLMEGNTDRVVDAIASVTGRGSADQGVRIIVEGS
ncbi:MAG: hypothetical protein ACLUPW_10775 [Bifidobacterium pseudocatenulatum]